MLYQRVLITGANGLLGQALVEKLTAEPDYYDVLATARDEQAKFRGFSCGYTPLDITQPEDVRQLIWDFSPDVVVHTAAMTHVDECETQRDLCWQTNVNAVEQIVRVCRSQGVRLILLSTDFIFDGEQGPYDERARPNPINFYGRSKLAAENAARTLHPTLWTIVRTVLVYGTAQNLNRNDIARWIIAQLREGKPVRLVTDQWRTPTYVHDLAAGIESLIRYRKNGVWNLSGWEWHSVFEFGRIVAETLNLDPQLILPTDSTQFIQPAKRPLKSGLLVTRAAAELGYQPHAIPENIQDLVRRMQVIGKS